MEDKGFMVSALKYRPAVFDEVVGQQGITSTLMNAIESEELAKAYLFCGPRGVGKTTCARIFAKAINQKYIPEGTELSFNIFELDAASNNGVDDIRNLIDQVRIQPQLGKYKVYVIDEVHMLSTQAFNAFLKTLEEPPPHAIFILATTEKHKVLPTILSRCQIYDFQRIQVKDIVVHLAKIAKDQGVNYEEEALHLIANKADGALRDALSLFDQMVSFTGKDLRYESVANNLNVLDYEYFLKVTDYVKAGDIGNALLILDEILQRGFDGLLFLIGLAEHLRNLLVSMDASTVRLLDTTDQVKQAYLDQASQWTAKELVATLDAIHKGEMAYKTSKNKRLLTELTLMQLAAKHMEDGAALEKKTPRETPFIAKKEPQTPSLGAAQTQPEAVKEKILKGPEVSEELKVEEPIRPIIEAIQDEPAPKDDSLDLTSQATEPEGDKITEVENLRASAPMNPSSPPRKRRKSSAFSLNEMEEAHDLQAQEKVEDEASDHQEEIDPARLKTAWKAYADKMHDMGKFSFYSTLMNNQPEVLDDRRIRITLENEVQESDLSTEKADLMAFVRNELNHPGLVLESVIDIEDKGNIGFRTPKEQFQEMAEKNPNLRKLTKQFDLDLEY